jgi:mevalonate kinase
MIEGSGFGKVILFNEHFVVYNIPAIASAIGMKTVASIEQA